MAQQQIDERFAFITNSKGEKFQVLKYQDVLDENGEPTNEKIAIDWDEAATAELINQKTK